ncbi:possible kinase [Synechococcus sp. CC9902]|uniref:ABC1 kinase family protein n=1 Tax=Synechococcus sp. (strain CC9902) TaxID=316279 RepID=UPI00005D44EC|nr:AarF/ABC1/UbiB kinase family protein [Synechococcus sp. CC9902]ABB27120.1 possible kinase [Synechococcus sp. CC9902]
MRRLNIAFGLQRAIRALVIWRAVLTLLVLLWWDGQSWTYRGGATRERRAERQQQRAQWLTRQLLELGSAFIKLGQLLSSRPDILPAGWVSELASLQDNVPAFSFDRVQTVLEEELGPRCAEVIDLDPQPLGAASLAQVHRASLRSGRQVVLKVQRQGLDRRFRLDLDVMQQVAAVLQRHPSWGRGRDWPAMARECRRVLLRELDFRVEAQYAARFRQQFLDDDQIRIPGVIWELSTRRVLCLDYLPGIKINDREAIVEAGIDPSEVAEIGAASYLKQLVRFGFFHADPHPGNLAVASDGALIYYDFGMMGVLSDGLRRRLGSMVRAAAARDSAALVAELQAAGLIGTEIDVGPVRRLVRVMLQDALTPPFSSNVIDKLSGDLYDLVYGQPFRLPVELIFVMRALSTFEGVGRSLDPAFSLVSIAKPYLLPLMTSSGPGTNDLFNELGRQVGALSSKAVGIPRRLDESLERLEQGDLQLQVRLGESDRQFRRMIVAQQSIGQAVLLGCLALATAIVGASSRPLWSILPAAATLPVGLGWFRMQMRMRRDQRLEQLPGSNR